MSRGDKVTKILAELGFLSPKQQSTPVQSGTANDFEATRDFARQLVAQDEVKRKHAFQPRQASAGTIVLSLIETGFDRTNKQLTAAVESESFELAGELCVKRDKLHEAEKQAVELVSLLNSQVQNEEFAAAANTREKLCALHARVELLLGREHSYDVEQAKATDSESLSNDVESQQPNDSDALKHEHKVESEGETKPDAKSGAKADMKADAKATKITVLVNSPKHVGSDEDLCEVLPSHSDEVRINQSAMKKLQRFRGFLSEDLLKLLAALHYQHRLDGIEQLSRLQTPDPPAVLSKLHVLLLLCKDRVLKVVQAAVTAALSMVESEVFQTVVARSDASSRRLMSHFARVVTLLNSNKRRLYRQAGKNLLDAMFGSLAAVGNPTGLIAELIDVAVTCKNKSTLRLSAVSLLFCLIQSKFTGTRAAATVTPETMEGLMLLCDSFVDHRDSRVRAATAELVNLLVISTADTEGQTGESVRASAAFIRERRLRELRPGTGSVESDKPDKASPTDASSIVSRCG